MGKGEIKYATYEKSKNLIIVRFQKILSKVIAILQEAASDPLPKYRLGLSVHIKMSYVKNVRISN